MNVYLLFSITENIDGNKIGVKFTGSVEVIPNKLVFFPLFLLKENVPSLHRIQPQAWQFFN